MRRLPFTLPTLLVVSGCMGPSAYTTGRPATEQDYRPVGELQRGLDLAGADVALAASFDMSAARQSALGPGIEAAVVPQARDGGDAVVSALREAERVWVFVTPRPNEVLDVVFVLEGTAAEALREHASAQRANQYPRTANGVTEYVVGELQVAIRAPDTVVLGSSRDSRGQRGSVWDWTDWADRLRGVSRGEPKPELAGIRDAMGAADAPIWAAWRRTPELDAFVWGRLAAPASAEPLFAHVTGLGFGAYAEDGGLGVRAVARAADPDLAATLAADLPAALPELARLLPGLATRVEGADVYATVSLSPEALARVLAARAGG